jgi:hypothetical protein
MRNSNPKKFFDFDHRKVPYDPVPVPDDIKAIIIDL